MTERSSEKYLNPLFNVAKAVKAARLSQLTSENIARSSSEIKPSPTMDFSPKASNALEAEITGLSDSIVAIVKASGAPGVSIGILHATGTAQHLNFGLRNVEESLPTSEHTIYHIASTGKFITALAVAHLVHDDYLDWDEPLKNYLPADCWSHPDEEVREKVTIRHCLTHTTGLAAQNRLWLAERGRMNFGPDETFKCFQGLEKLAPVGSKWIYNNWGYAVAGKLVEVVTGLSWAEYLAGTIFRPLAMHDTVTDPECLRPHVAMGYMVDTDGRPVRNGRPDAGANAVQAGASGIQSSVHDLLLLYRWLYENKTIPFDINPLLGGEIDLGIRETIYGHEQSYGMGWVKTQAPGVLTMNPRDTPIIGQATTDGTNEGAAGPMILHHNGNYPGYTSAAFLLPETKGAVVVLTNAVGKIEAAETIGQMIVETILNHGKGIVEPIDWVGNAQRNAAAYNQSWANMAFQLERERKSGTRHLPLEDYTGKYYNHVGNWFMEIFLDSSDGTSLGMCMQGHKEEAYQRYRLKHYHCDVFSWLLTLDECVRRGRSPICSKSFYLLCFEVEKGVVTGMRWKHDSSVAEASFFSREQ